MPKSKNIKLLTNYIQQRSSSEAHSFLAEQKIHALYETRNFITVFAISGK
jgi:hypothetical protein